VHDENWLWRGTGDRDGNRLLCHALDITVLLAGGIAYALNQHISAPSFFKSYFDDVLAGAMLCAWSGLMASKGSQAHRFVTSIPGSLFIVGTASLVWECVTPLVLSRSTPDSFDIVAYFSGALIYLVVPRFGRAAIQVNQGR
jgi:hypothetical protein